MSKFAEIKRVTLAGSGFNKIDFTNPCARYLIKNFTNGDIYVSFENDATTDTSAKIPKDYAQVLDVAEYKDVQNYIMLSQTATIYAKGTGEIEVIQLCLK